MIICPQLIQQIISSSTMPLLLPTLTPEKSWHYSFRRRTKVMEDRIALASISMEDPVNSSNLEVSLNYLKPTYRLFCTPFRTILCIQLDIIGWEQARVATEMPKPPVLVRELQIGDLVAFAKAQLCMIC